MNVPSEVRDGLLETLNNSLNERNRPAKLAKCGFSTSEDALTWTVFAHLTHNGQLGSVFHRLAMLKANPSAATLLLWGVPVPSASVQGHEIRSRLIAVCDALGENKKSRSEPDVIIDLADGGIVIVEVKYLSPNATERDDRKYEKYLKGSDAFVNGDSVRRSHLYELIRNWRIASDLAAGRSFTLLNLVTRERKDDAMKLFLAGIASSPAKRFMTITWPRFVGQCSLAPWLKTYLEARSITPQQDTPEDLPSTEKQMPLITEGS